MRIAREVRSVACDAGRECGPAACTVGGSLPGAGTHARKHRREIGRGESGEPRVQERPAIGPDVPVEVKVPWPGKDPRVELEMGSRAAIFRDSGGCTVRYTDQTRVYWQRTAQPVLDATRAMGKRPQTQASAARRACFLLACSRRPLLLFGQSHSGTVAALHVDCSSAPQIAIVRACCAA